MRPEKARTVFILFFLMMILTGCSNYNYAPVLRPVVPKNKPGQYYVRRGDTLFSIAWAYGLDYRTLERINGIHAGEEIQPGQYLIVNPTHASRQNRAVNNYSVSAAKTVRTPQSVAIQTAKLPPVSGWVWPAQGRVIQTFAPAQGDKGINIAGVPGSPIRAAAAGIVVYAGTGLVAYGKLIIIKNSDNYLSAYAHNQTMLVAEGAQVKQGQIIAKMGNTGTTTTMLHFEIRKNGQPVNPLLYLASTRR